MCSVWTIHIDNVLSVNNKTDLQLLAHGNQKTVLDLIVSIYNGIFFIFYYAKDCTIDGAMWEQYALARMFI